MFVRNNAPMVKFFLLNLTNQLTADSDECIV